ncbi:alpha/beta hydrolase [Ramlibacter sp. AN1133]|uniref:alpha/beta hydrolase n=1 Tax=Ramlibacter sp. AN1133 TaxID=3133429 RepID=UPI0030BB34D7
MKRRDWLAALALALGGIVPAIAQTSQVLDLPTPRGVQQRGLAIRPEGEPERVLLLLTGGGGALGIFDNGSLRHDGNFLIRSRSLFVQQGQAVVLVDTPSDRRELRGDFRESEEHAQDLGAVVAWARRTFARPVWIVGTSRGTQSAANAAVRLAGDAAPDGVVLTSTILGSSRFGTSTARPVQEMGVEKLRMPVLVMHHAQDACQVCPPQRLPELMAKLPAGRSALRTYEGGRSQGPLCEPLAYHGFNGIEDRVVADMVAWMREAK